MPKCFPCLTGKLVRVDTWLSSGTYVIDIDFIFNISIDIDPVLLVAVNWNKINIHNIVVAAAVVVAIVVAVIAWIAFNTRW